MGWGMDMGWGPAMGFGKPFGKACGKSWSGFDSEGKGKESSQEGRVDATASSGREAPTVHWIAIGEESSLVGTGLPNEAPVLEYSKSYPIFSSAAHILGDLLTDIKEVKVEDDADWKLYPEVGEACKTAMDQEHCFAVASCP